MSSIDWTQYQRLADAARARLRDAGLVDYCLDAALRERSTVAPEHVSWWLTCRYRNYLQLHSRRAVSLDILTECGHDVPARSEDQTDWQTIEHKIQSASNDPRRGEYLIGVAHFLADGYTLADIARQLGGSIQMAFRAKQRLASILA
jgi:hypothetical protein